MGSVMIGSIFPNEQREAQVILDHAKDFLNQYYISIRRYVERSTTHFSDYVS